jgi:hypothetical protein
MRRQGFKIMYEKTLRRAELLTFPANLTDFLGMAWYNIGNKVSKAS